MYFADLHIHSRFSRATSRDCDAPHLDLWARRKGISLVGMGDFTHPAWREEMKEYLSEAEDGLYRLKEEYRLENHTAGEFTDPRFVVSGEISTIYKKDGKTRKVHHLILLPSLQAAEHLAQRLETVGNIRSDGRPILGLDSRDLLEITLESCPDCIFIPAHIWTPHFSLFGAFSGFHTLEECYGDLSGHIHALETGLSSDPMMNRRLSMLDKYTLVSHSDAHSPAKLGREANMLEGPLGYSHLKHSMETGEHFLGTVEFFPEEGKYHLDGHRPCRCRLEPEQTRKLGGRCPVCGAKVTVGVLHRVEELADRVDPGMATPFESLMPLCEVLGSSLDMSPESKKVQALYLRMLEELGPEFHILRNVPPEAVARIAGETVAEGLRRLRAGQVIRLAGYDGEYGKIGLFAPGETAEFQGQMRLAVPEDRAMPALPEADIPHAQTEVLSPSLPQVLNPEQQACVHTGHAHLAVIAGPGTGKTKTLVARVEHLLSQGAAPSEITAVTFTRQAALELRSRLEDKLGKKALRGLTVGTFHSICLKLIPAKPLLDPAQALEIAAELADSMPPRDTLRSISRQKCDGIADDPLTAGYQARLAELGVRDMDDILLEALEAPAYFRHLLVDECQDINAAQRRLMEKWSRDGETLFAIGDPDQSIYGFRGASAACFAQLKDALPDLETLTLSANYRSAPDIVDFSLKIIDKNPGAARRLTPMQKNGMPIRAIQTSDAGAEGAWIAGEIMRMVGGMDMHETRSDQPARAFSDIAVLCRTRRQLDMLEAALRRQDIPCMISGSGDMLSEAEAQGAVALFRHLLDPSDRSSHLRARRVPHFEEVSEALHSSVRKEKPAHLMTAFQEITEWNTPGLAQMAAAAAQYRDMETFLHALLLGEEADIRRMSGNKRASGAVQLMTLHAAKGLEFPAVFLAGLSDGAFPLKRQGRVESPEEERRLYFVGATRAREELILTCGGAPSEFWLETAPDSRALIRPKVKLEQMSLF